MAFCAVCPGGDRPTPFTGERQVVSEHEKLAKLEQLRAEGLLTEAEHDQAKAQLEQRADDEQDGAPEAATGPDLEPQNVEPQNVEPQNVEPQNVEPQNVDGHDTELPDSDGRDAQPRRRRQLPLWAMIAWPVALAAAGIGLIVWALTSGGSGSSGTPVNGLIAVVDHQAVAPDAAVSLDTQFGSGGYAVGKPCHTLTGYPDIVAGSPVVITDGSGKTLVRTKLRAGVFDVNADCVFGFVTSVRQSDTYRIKVGQRDPVAYPAAAITHPQLSLGG